MPATVKISLFSSLSHRSFALLWGGQTVSRLGDSIFVVALAWWVLDTTGSAVAMGTVLIFSTAPELIFLLVGGVAVDRFSRLGLMLASDLLRGAVVGLVALLAWQDRLSLWHLFVLSAVFGTVRAFFYPAYTAVIPDVVPAAALPSANSLRSLSLHGASVVGPAIGGFVVAQGGTPIAFTLDALSFLVSAACLAGAARHPALHRRPKPATGALRDLREGFATVLGTPWLWITIAIAGLSNVTLAGPLYAALPLLVRQDLGASVRVYALLNSLSAAGAILAAIWLGRFARLRRRGALTYLAWMVAALMALVMELPVSVVGVGAAMLIYGAAETMLGLVWTNTLQEEAVVPRERLGRVASIDALGSSALLPVGFGIAGLAADRLGPSTVFIVGGAVSAAVIGLGLLHPAVRNLD